MPHDADSPLIQKALAQIEEHAAATHRLKHFVNEADKLEGREPRFSDLNESTLNASPATVQTAIKKWQPGAFFNKPFSAAVRSILLARAPNGGANPASVDEIHDALVQGSFNFSVNSLDAQKNSIRISLGKNSAAFIRLPNSDLFGLVEWYGRPKKGKKASGSNGNMDSVDDAADEAATDDAVVDLIGEEEKEDQE